ncbi:MAG TPA: hypothetical protein PLC40_14960, partial [Candidatus Hydrogenedentes bacterium]|nr:hypothetical protein [Candidatus Hydrogenedentota bacterium]
MQKGTQEAAIGTGQYAMGNIEGAKQTFTNLPHEVAAETVNVLPSMMLFGGPGNVATGVRQAVSNEAIEGRAIRRLAEAVEKEQALPKQQPPPPQAPPGPEQGPQAGPIPPGAQPGTWTPPQGEETPVGTTLSTGILPRPEDLTRPQPTTEQAAQGPVEPEWAPAMRKRGWAVEPVLVEQPGAAPVQGWDVNIDGKHLLFTPPMDPEGVGSPRNFLHSVAQDHIQSEDPAKRAAAKQAAAVWNNTQATPEQVETARQQAVAAGIRGTGGTITFQQGGQTDILGIIGLYDLERETGTKFHETAHLTRTFFLNARENKQVEKEKAFKDEQGQFDEEKFANAARAESLRQKYRGMALEEYGTGIEKTIHKFNQRVGDFIGNITGKSFEQIVREMNSGKLMARGVQTTPEQQRAQGARAPEQAPIVVPVEQGQAIETDPARIQEIRNSIIEGEMILKSGRTVSGRKMGADELAAVQRAVNNSRAKLGEQATGQEARPLTGQEGAEQAAPAQQTPVPEPVTQEVTPKQPWEMTREDVVWQGYRA